MLGDAAARSREGNYRRNNVREFTHYLLLVHYQTGEARKCSRPQRGGCVLRVGVLARRATFVVRTQACRRVAHRHGRFAADACAAKARQPREVHRVRARSVHVIEPPARALRRGCRAPRRCVAIRLSCDANRGRQSEYEANRSMLAGSHGHTAGCRQPGSWRLAQDWLNQCVREREAHSPVSSRASPVSNGSGVMVSLPVSESANIAS